jgi:hypothetical protein
MNFAFDTLPNGLAQPNGPGLSAASKPQQTGFLGCVAGWQRQNSAIQQGGTCEPIGCHNMLNKYCSHHISHLPTRSAVQWCGSVSGDTAANKTNTTQHNTNNTAQHNTTMLLCSRVVNSFCCSQYCPVWSGGCSPGIGRALDNGGHVRGSVAVARHSPPALRAPASAAHLWQTP